MEGIRKENERELTINKIMDEVLPDALSEKFGGGNITPEYNKAFGEKYKGFDLDMILRYMSTIAKGPMPKLPTDKVELRKMAEIILRDKERQEREDARIKAEEEAVKISFKAPESEDAKRIKKIQEAQKKRREMWERQKAQAKARQQRDRGDE